jgi:hypothetical protein
MRKRKRIRMENGREREREKERETQREKEREKNTVPEWKNLHEMECICAVVQARDVARAERRLCNKAK